MSDVVQVFYDAQGQPVIAQMQIAEYERLVTMVKEAEAAKEKLKKVVAMLGQ